MPIRLLVALCAILACGGAAHGQSFPNQSFPRKPIRLVVGYSAGGGNDLIARIVAPAGTPPAVMTLLQEAIVYVVESPETRQALEAISVNPRSTSQRTFMDIIARDTARWKKVAATVNVTLD